MVNELIILLSDQQQQELIRQAKQASYDDDLAYLQLKIDEMLRDDSARLTHKEG